MAPNLRADFERLYLHTQGSAIRRFVECLGNPGFQALAVYRLGRWALHQTWARPFFGLVYGSLNLLIRILWGIEISRRATIGQGLLISHFGSIFIGSGVTLGSNCNISQDVTIGLAGQGTKGGVPTIGNDVYIAPGARVFGKITVGDNVKIGANAVVYGDIPSNAILVLDPGFRIVSLKGNRRPVTDASRAA